MKLKEGETEAQHVAKVLRVFADMIEDDEIGVFNDDHLNAKIEISWIGD